MNIMNKEKPKRMALVKVFKMNGELFGAYKRSSARVYFAKHECKYNGAYLYATYSDLLKAESNIIDPENEYMKELKN